MLSLNVIYPAFSPVVPSKLFATTTTLFGVFPAKTGATASIEVDLIGNLFPVLLKSNLTSVCKITPAPKSHIVVLPIFFLN